MRISPKSLLIYSCTTLFMIYIYYKFIDVFDNRKEVICKVPSIETTRLFTDSQLDDFYKTFIEGKINEDYLRPYRNITRENVESLLPSNIKLNNASKIMSCERNFIMKDFEKWVQKYKINCRRSASVNGPDPEEQYLKCSENKTYYNYKEKSDGRDRLTVDLYTLDLNEDKKIDFWSVQQTFEHVYNGHSVSKRLYKNTVCGGYMFVSVPIFNIPHLVPLHFYSYTPMGMITMFYETGWTVIDVGMWGNREFFIELLTKKTWPTLFDLLEAQEKSNNTRDFFVNDPFYGFQFWIIGLKNCSSS